MALEVKGMARKFILESRGEKISLDDLNPQTSVEEIKRLYCDQYPELSSATVTGPNMKDDALIYTFSPKAGTKG